MRPKSRSISLRCLYSSVSYGHGSSRFSFGGAEGPHQETGLVSLVGTIHDERDLQVVDTEGPQQVTADGGVVRLAWAQAEAEDLLEARGNQMNLGVESAAAPPNALRPPFFRAPVPSG